MHVLVVFCHPRRESFTGALLDGFVAGVVEADHEVELADLYREGFDPRFRVEDYAQFRSEPMPEEIVAEQRCSIAPMLSPSSSRCGGGRFQRC
jgi:NAD(P)H dehydrogenase (quinone)